MRFFRINISFLKAHFLYSSKLALGGVLQRAVLKYFKEITRKRFCRSLLLIKFEVYNLFKNKCFPLGHKCFPMTFSKSFRTPFINNMLLYITQMFCLEICEILQSIFFIEHLWQLFLLFVETMTLYITPRNFSSVTQIAVQLLRESIYQYQHISTTTIPANTYLFKVNNRNTRKKFEICSKLTIETPKRP